MRMRRTSYFLARLPALGWFLRLAYRAKTASGYYWKKLGYLVIWLFTSRELGNYATFDLTQTNKRHLASMIALITTRSSGEILAYFDEIEGDAGLIEHVRETTSKSPERFVSDLNYRCARRIGWYAIVRATKPRVVVETGVDKGLGSIVLCTALLKNREEGFEGRYYGTDIDPRAGFLLTGKYRDVGEILYGDSIETLKNFDESIDTFINDSDHSSTYERDEYEVIRDKLADEAIILGDNAHTNDELWNFSRSTGRAFLFFRETPDRHWYPGGGIGFSFRARAGLESPTNE